MPIRTKKIKIIIVGKTKEERKETRKHLLDTFHTLSTMANIIVRTMINNLDKVDYYMVYENLTKKDAIEKLQKEIGTSIQNSGYRSLSNFSVPSAIKTCLNQSITKKMNKLYYELKKCTVSVPTYKMGNTPLMSNKKVYKKDDSYYIDVPLTKENQKNRKKITFELYFGKDSSGNKVSVDRAIDGTYKTCNSFITYDNNKKEFYLNLVLDIPQKINNLDENKIMGIDLGMTRIVTFHITNTPPNRHPRQLKYDKLIIDKKKEFNEIRAKTYKNCSLNRGGHGRKRKTSKLIHIKEKQKNWSKTMNHLISKEVIDVCKKNNVGVIKMEDLTDISSERSINAREKKNNKKASKNYIFAIKNWGYYMLQKYISEKAECEGISVLWVDPKNTSITCPTCGETDKHHRLINREENKDNKEINASMFECLNVACSDFGIIKDCDVIAAINVANKEGFKVKPKSKEGRMKKVGVKTE